MSKKISGMDELVARHISDILPEVESEATNIAKSSVDVGVWLVGLATGVLALLITSDSVKATLEGNIYKTGIILFSFVILFGVLQRILFHIAIQKRWPISLRLRSILIGLTDKSVTAQELQEYWSVEDIVERLKDDFNVDYSFLMSNTPSIEKARECYMEQLEIHREFEKQGLDTLAEILCVHFGLPKEKENNYFQPEDIEEVRSRARTTNKVLNFSYISYYASAFFFAAGILIVSFGAI